MNLRAAYVACAVFAVFSLGVACSSPDTTARVDAIGPNVSQFDVVAPMLVRRCGSLDCHGGFYRNFRLYGYGGTRLASGDRPDFPATTRAEEIAADYEAVLGIEPERMRDVVNAGGAGYERLSLVRKARDDEAHKGGQRIKPGDDADFCLLSWLSNTVRADACQRAACIVDGGITKPCEP